MELNMNISNIADLLWCIIYQRYGNCIQLSSVIIITIIIGYFFFHITNVRYYKIYRRIAVAKRSATTRL